MFTTNSKYNHTNILSKCVDYSNQDSLVQNILNMLFKTNNIQENFLIHVEYNRFIGQNNKDIITSIFRQAYRNKFLIEKTIRRWIFRNKRLVYINDTDMLLEPFDNNKKYPEIIDGNGVYRFSPGDIFNMIINKVVYSEYQVPRILPIKNPWSNKIFNKTELYNLFVSSYKITKTPWIMTEYAKVDFDNKKMLYRHQSYLNEQAVILDISNFSESDFRKEAEYIFVNNIYLPLKKYKIFKYSTLKTVPIKILRKYFKQMIINNHLKGGITFKISPDDKKLLFKLWNNYPSIISSNKIQRKIGKKRFKRKKHSNNLLYENDLARARGLYAYNDILYYSQSNNPPNGINLSADLPEIFNIEFSDINFNNSDTPNRSYSLNNTSLYYHGRNLLRTTYNNIYSAIATRPYRQSSFNINVIEEHLNNPQNTQQQTDFVYNEPTPTERISFWNEINSPAPAPAIAIAPAIAPAIAIAPAPAPAPVIAIAPAPAQAQAPAIAIAPNNTIAIPESRQLFVFGNNMELDSNNVSNPQSRTIEMSIDEELETDYDY
tara:strand:- start:4735 stop:6372 length:1638 start_codon:yes stop_codon:yes gene_type:complete